MNLMDINGFILATLMSSNSQLLSGDSSRFDSGEKHSPHPMTLKADYIQLRWPHKKIKITRIDNCCITKIHFLCHA